MAHLKSVPFRDLETESINHVKCGSDMAQACGSYGAYTIYTASGKEYVVWNSMGEINLSLVEGRT